MTSAFYFARPEWFFALIPLSALWLLRHHVLLWPPIIKPLSMRYPLLEALRSGHVQGNTHAANQVSLPLLLLTLLLLISALAQPVRQGAARPQTDNPQAVDLILLANTSVSMVLKDSRIDGRQVDRMSKQIDVLGKLVKHFRGERIALVILGRPAAVMLPLTSDRNLVLSMLTRLQTTLGGRNSDIGATLQLVSERFPPGDGSGANKKIILLSTDAYQQLGAQAPQQAAERLTRLGYQLDTLAIGSSRFPEHLLGKAHLIYRPVDLALLQQLAVIGKGKMLRASDDAAVPGLLTAIGRNARQSVKQQPRPLISLYQYPLLAALLLLVWQWLGAPMPRRRYH